MREALDKAAQAAGQIQKAVQEVPAEWWKATGFNLTDIADALAKRSGALEEIINLKKWEGLDDATKGGRLL